MCIVYMYSCQRAGTKPVLGLRCMMSDSYKRKGSTCNFDLNKTLPLASNT